MKTKKIYSAKNVQLRIERTVFAILTMAALFLAPQNLRADDAATIAAQINSLSLGTGSFTAAANGNTVEVTGAVTNATTGFGLVIDAGVTVKWGATFSGLLPPTDGLVYITGSGLFEVIPGGYIENEGTNWSVQVNNSTIIVNGGTVSAPDGIAIIGINNSGITVKSGIVSSINDCAINAQQSNVDISGGTVSATTDDAIRSWGDVHVSGGTVSATTGYAINSQQGNVDVSGGTVSTTTTGNTIISFGISITVSVSGGIVTSEDGNCIGVFGAGSNITVNNGSVSTTGGTALVCYGGGNVDVSGGSVSATSGSAIITSSGNVDVGGGSVTATNANAIYTNDGNITVNGGSVSVTSGTAISLGNASATATVSGGTVSATSGYAIYPSWTANIVTVSDGFVFAYGNSMSDVIGGSSFTGPTSVGVVAAWDNTTGISTYTNGSNDDLTVFPAGSVSWDKVSGQSGVSFANGTNTGFFEIAGVDVVNDITTTSITLTAPVKGVNSTSASVAVASYAHTSTNWAVTGGGASLATGSLFAASTAYTATIVLTSQSEYRFDDPVSIGSITIAGGTVVSATTAGNDSGNTLTVVVDYPATAVDTPPAAGGGETVTNIMQSSLTLNWSAATDDLTPPANLKYYVYLSTGNNITTVADCATNGTLLNTGGTANITTYNVTGLTANTTYWFNIVVEDGAGNLTAYMPVSATTIDTQLIANQQALATAQAILQNATFSFNQTSANTLEEVLALLVARINALIASTGITVKASDITIYNFKAAVAGSSGNAKGSNGSFMFTITLKKGGSSLGVSNLNGTIIATEASFTITVITEGNGSVSVSPASTPKAGDLIVVTVTPGRDCELDEISAYSTDSPEIPVYLYFTGGNPIFSMPACDITVVATFRQTGTGNGNVSSSTALKAYAQNGTLHVSGLTAGKPWRMYGVSGALIYQGIAAEASHSLPLPGHGIYIIQSDNRTIKVTY